MARTIEALIAEYISEKINHLMTESKCCVHMVGPYRQLERVLVYRINALGLMSRVHMINGFEVLKIYKMSCSHNIHQPSTLHLTEKSLKNILYYLKNTDHDLSQQETYISPQLFKSLKQKPILPPNRFTIGSIRQMIYQKNNIDDEAVFKTWKIYPFKEAILQKISNSQVVVINGEICLEKSTAVPMFIVNECTKKGSYCKILCVEANNLSAITHSTILAKRINERIGSRVGFQVYLQSRVCDSTNIIYTTAVFLLRVLIGQNPQDSLRNITHIVISDVHLHHAYADIVLCELKNVLHFYPQMKVILLSDSRTNTKFRMYFAKSDELRLQLDAHEVKVYHMEEINSIIESNHDRLHRARCVKNILSPVTSLVSVGLDFVDKALEAYALTGSDSELSKFLHLVHSDNVSVDYSHSKFGYTALTLAAKHGNSSHAIRLLTCKNVSSMFQDGEKNSAIEYAMSRNNVNYARVLEKNFETSTNELKPPPIDFPLISQLIQILTTNWIQGHILVFLPTYEDLLKLNFAILKLQFTGKISQDISIYLLHSNMQYNELLPIISDSSTVKIVLATRMAESLTYLNDITYVIDCGQESYEKYIPAHKCKMTTIEWASADSLQRRTQIASRKGMGHCFRLFLKNLVGKLSSETPPELLFMPMDRIALFLKFLCPEKAVVEYIAGLIVQPPIEHVRHSTEYLKQIDIFDCMEEVTWLGCRLIDVPMDLELGKALVLSILLKCLDPVLTIVSFLASTNARERTLCHSYQDQQQKKEESKPDDNRLFSDDLILLRLYQIWQNDKRENIVNDVLSNETTFVVNGILDKICQIRTYLVGAMRSSQLIHNQGQLSMHSINAKANNWAVIKAALAGGLYPNLCMVERQQERLKSKSQQVCIPRISTLHTLACASCKFQPSDWIVFYGESGSGIMSTISNCTLINPVTIVLSAGKSELDPGNIYFPKWSSHAVIFIDEWIWLRADIKSAILLFCLRQRFRTAYLDFLQTCGSSDMWRKNNKPSCETYHICDLISKVLLEEDISAGFAQPIRVGNRPKAITNKFTSDYSLEHQVQVDLSTPPPPKQGPLKKEFFLLGVFDRDENMKTLWKQPGLDISRHPLLTSICKSVCPRTITYVIECNLNKKQITKVGVVKSKNGGYFLHNRFHVSIPIYDVIIMCKANRLEVPSLSKNRIPVKLEESVGELILDLL